MQQSNGIKFSRDRENHIDFQLDVLGGGGRAILKRPMDVLCERIDMCAASYDLCVLMDP